MHINNIKPTIPSIIKEFNLKVSERVILKKTAGFYDFVSTNFEPSYTLDYLRKEIKKEKSIALHVLKKDYGIYHMSEYKKMRETLAKFFADKGFLKLAKDILRFDCDDKPHLRASDLNHIQKIVSQLSQVMSDSDIKEKISRILAKFL